jgi:hypothetical protein
VLKGELVGASGWGETNQLGCSVTAVIKPSNGRILEYLERRTDYGNHSPWVYGDYTQEIRQLGKMLNLDVEIIS